MMPGETKDFICGIITESRSPEMEKLAMKEFKKNMAMQSTIVMCKEGYRYDQKEVVVHIFILCRILDL